MLEDKRLVWKLKRGDADALRRIYEKYKDDLLTVAVSLLNETAAAEDILHDVFVSFAEDVERFHLYGSLRSYFITCVVNRVRDRFRSKMYQVVEIDSVWPVGSNSADDPAETLLDSERTQLLTEALAQLPIGQREVVILHLQGGMKFREIAEMQRISINTVQGRYRYGLDKLRSVLNGQVTE
jgi:RNA polymerase sigma-70 factor (ECF subfamily)